VSLPGLEDSPRIRNAVHRILEPRGALAHYLWESLPLYGDYIDELPLRPDLRVLDVGCGVGRTTLVLAQWCPEGMVTGVDINPALAECAKQLAQLFQLEGNTRFLAGDVAEAGTLPKGETFDLIYARHVISDVKQAGLRELARRLSPKGVMAVLEPDFSLCRAYGLPQLDAHLRREGEYTREAGLSGGNLRHLLREAGLKVTRFEPKIHVFTEQHEAWVTFARKRLTALYEEEIPQVEALRFRRGSQWVDERIRQLRDQIEEFRRLTKRHPFTHIFIQFLALATK